MTADVFRNGPRGTGAGATMIWLGGIAIVWVLAVVVLAANGVFDVPASEPALPTLVAIVAPVAVFVAMLALSSRVRALVMRADPVLLTELQAWRILGGVFLVVYALGGLPGFFALPAGIGDVAIGIAAPFVAWRLRRDPAFLLSARYRLFHYFGLADFLIAVATGIAARNAIPGLVGEVTTAAMGQLPLVLIPTVAVPAFIVLHLIVLLQAHAASHAEKAGHARQQS